jgi:hypothetical protein
MKKPLNYYGFAFDDPKEYYNEEFLETKKGKKEIKKQKKSKKRLKKQIKERGFDESETWNLDETIARFILPRLKYFRDTTMGHPGDYKTYELWQKDIDIMIRAFEIVVENDFDLKVNKEYEEGIELFSKKFTHLWS